MASKKEASSFTVIGPNAVAGVDPGGTVTRAKLGPKTNVQVLIDGGHITPTLKPTSSVSAKPTEESGD